MSPIGCKLLDHQVFCVFVSLTRLNPKLSVYSLSACYLKSPRVGGKMILKSLYSPKSCTFLINQSWEVPFSPPFSFRLLYDLSFDIPLFSFCHQRLAQLYINEIFDYKITWGTHGKNLLHITINEMLLIWGNVIWQAPITGMFSVYYWTQQKWNSCTMHIWLCKFILRNGEVETLNSCL